MTEETEVAHRWQPKTLVASLITDESRGLVEGHIYLLGHQQGHFTKERLPAYWVVGDDGTSHVVLESDLERASKKHTEKPRFDAIENITPYDVQLLADDLDALWCACTDDAGRRRAESPLSRQELENVIDLSGELRSTVI